MNFLIDFGVKSTLALGIAFLVAWPMRRASAAAASMRYALWTCALAGVLVLPLALWIGPAWNIDRGVVQIVPQTQPATSVVVHARRSAPAPTWPQKLPMIVWIAGAMATLARTAAGHWRVRSLFGKAEQIRDTRWLGLAAEIGASIGLQRAVRLKRSTATDVPLSYGLLRATVLLPSESDSWSDERRRVVLSHEMVHARRLDSLWGLLAQVALAVNWFNPLAWLAAKEFRKEQERSCDDAVVMAGTASTVYAAHLVDLARSIAIPEPALGMAERFDLEGRVHALLDAGRVRKAANWKVCAAMFAGAMALLVPLAAIHAQSPAAMTGVVYDPSGAIIPGATISLKNIGGQNEEVARADAAGRYKLQTVPAGQYLMKVMVPGFATYQKELTLGAGSASAVNVNLSIGEVREAVDIVGKRPQPAMSASATPQRIRVGGMVQTIKLISKVNPDYPADAQAEGVEGTVMLKAIVSKDGSLLSIKSVSNGIDPRLVRAAMAAVPLWRYQPALLNGEPVEVVTTIDVTFRLN
jgi:TonB family protein